MNIRFAVAAALILTSTAVSVAAASPGGHVSGYVLVALNPQPEPPGVQQIDASAKVSIPDPASRVELNPQPEPPGVYARQIYDARKLPPGPCRSLLVVVKVPGLPPVTTTAKSTPVAGKCIFDVAVPSAAIGTRAAVKFSRDTLR